MCNVHVDDRPVTVFPLPCKRIQEIGREQHVQAYDGSGIWKTCVGSSLDMVKCFSRSVVSMARSLPVCIPTPSKSYGTLRSRATLWQAITLVFLGRSPLLLLLPRLQSAAKNMVGTHGMGGAERLGNKITLNVEMFRVLRRDVPHCVFSSLSQRRRDSPHSRRPRPALPYAPSNALVSHPLQ